MAMMEPPVLVMVMRASRHRRSPLERQLEEQCDFSMMTFSDSPRRDEQSDCVLRPPIGCSPKAARKLSELLCRFTSDDVGQLRNCVM